MTKSLRQQRPGITSITFTFIVYLTKINMKQLKFHKKILIHHITAHQMKVKLDNKNSQYTLIIYNTLIPAENYKISTSQFQSFGNYGFLTVYWRNKIAQSSLLHFRVEMRDHHHTTFEDDKTIVQSQLFIIMIQVT